MPTNRQTWEAWAREDAAREGLPVAGYLALIERESGWNPNAASTAGARGLLQFMPATAAELGIDPHSPAAAIAAGAAYLVDIRHYLDTQGVPVSSWAPVLAGYNWGMGNVRRAWLDYGADWLSHAPTETREYVAALLPLWDGGGGLSAIVVALLAVLGLWGAWRFGTAA